MLITNEHAENGEHWTEEAWLDGEELCDGKRTVYLTFDVDRNGSGQQAAQRLACRLNEQGLNARRVSFPDGHDPNSFFVQGGDAQQFRCLLEEALP